MPQELLVIFLGWVAVIAMPILLAFIIWTSNARRKRISPARPSRSSRGMDFPSDQDGIDRIVFGLRPVGLGQGLSLIEFRLKSGDRVPAYKLTRCRMTNKLNRMVFEKSSCRIFAAREVGS